MFKTQIVNRAAGPRMFHVKNAENGPVMQVTLQPGEAREVTLAADPEKDPIMAAWSDSGEVLFGADAQKAMRRKADDPQALTARRAELQAELSDVETKLAALVVDPSTITPPAQQGGDGGPQQGPTVDPKAAGLPTPEQGDGTAEQKRVAAEVAKPAATAPKPATTTTAAAKSDKA